ncbi:hypothetical protein [Persicobacter psychrovividus]|uniref:Uncharacterized protein n=1 Tax=Persicobacter psychrovividus TaxID=387638 RepID=A0ABN6LDX9_9BACT|nr:hypothetical protein PEPS_36910 [Persicobacter psychrovividus]
MEQNDFETIESEVKKAIAKYKWEHLSSYFDQENFGNWIIELQNNAFKLRLVNDRGDIRTDAHDGTEWQLANNFFAEANIETVANCLDDNSEQANEDIFQYLSQVLMNLNAYNSTNIEAELERGRIPVFLERTEIEFLCNEWRKIPKERLTEDQRKLWQDIAFKGQASLHKRGMDYKPTFPEELNKYK